MIDNMTEDSRFLREIRNRQFFSVFITAILGSIGELISGFIDGVMTGTFLGSDAMAAYGIASPYFMLNALLSLSFQIAAQSLCTKEIGRGNEDSARKIFSFCIWTAIFLSAVFSFFGFMFPEQLAELMGANDSMPAIKSETVQYLRWLFAGMVFSCFSAVSSVALNINGAAGLVKISAITVAVLDVVGDILNIFVFHGGMAGMGMVTAVSHIGSAVVVMLYFFRKDSLFTLRIHLYSVRYAGEVFRASYTEAILWVLRVFVPIIVNRIIIAVLGITVLTAMSIQRNLLSLVSIVAYGLGDTTMMMLGLCYGESDRKTSKETMRSIMIRLVVFTVSLMLPVIFLSEPLTGLYCDVSDVELFRITVSAVILLAISIPFTAAAKVFLRSLQVMEKNSYTMTLNVAQVMVLPCFLTPVLCYTVGDSGAFIAYTVSELVAAVMGFVFYRKAVNHPDTFPVSEDRIFRGTVVTPEQSVEISRQIGNFCEKNECEKSISFKLSLCVEEMGCAILNEGLLKDSSSRPFVNFVVLIHQDSIVMRVKDNCADQQLRDRALMWKLDSEHPERLIGIRMVMKMATDFKYIRVLNVNNAIIKFVTDSAVTGK
ncbi:MAG: hypothetical protein MJ052_00240 [Sphaerochaetaceae bacterium]|nr:hypothetical protein [Sphaerochaetaceae bacterium]